MFGALLGTLAKFRKEETMLKDKVNNHRQIVEDLSEILMLDIFQEDKRAKIEQRLEENARQEKESIRKERHELFLERRRQQAHVRRLEWKMHRIREVDQFFAATFCIRYLFIVQI